METTKKPLSIRIIYWATTIIFWIFVAAAAVGMVFGMLMLFGYMDETQLHVGVPVAINIVEEGIVDLFYNQVKVEFVEMYGKVHFIDTPVFIAQIYSVFMMIMMGIFFFIFLTFKMFIVNVYRGLYFESRNIALLKRIAYALVGVWGFTAFYAYFQYYFLMQHLELSSISVQGDIQTYPVILLGALFLWVLSHVFMKGSELQEESNYTI